MKVKMKKNTLRYSGKLEGLVYYYHPSLDAVLARRLPKMPRQPMNDRYRNISLALKALNPSPQYRQDFAKYLKLLKESDDEITMISWHNLFVKMMWNLASQYPDINLETISRGQIFSRNLPVKTLKEAVDAGLLPKVKGYTRFTAVI